ncbi:hypothetical protein Tco_0513622 [Tanacetum coccineum]
MKGLSECKASESNIRRIQVKDIVKEVEDYLKTYSSAGMDISCTLEKGLTIVEGDGYMKKMYDMAETYGLIDLYITHVAWMTLKDFLHFLGNRSASFSEMVVAAPVANNAVGAEVVPPSASRRWRGVVARPVGSPWRVIAPSSYVDSKGKRVTFPNSAGSPSFKKRKHVVLDEGPSSPKSVPDIAPSDEACKTLFGSLASTEDLGDSDPFLPGCSFIPRCYLATSSYPDVQARLDGEAQSLSRRYSAARLLSRDIILVQLLLDLPEKLCFVGKRQALREVASSGYWLYLVDRRTLIPKAEQNYDKLSNPSTGVKSLMWILLVHYCFIAWEKLMLKTSDQLLLGMPLLLVLLLTLSSYSHSSLFILCCLM